MIGILVATLMLMLASAAARRFFPFFTCGFTAVESFMLSSFLGLILLAYAVLFLGLIGQLSATGLGVAVCILTFLGLRTWTAQKDDFLSMSQEFAFKKNLFSLSVAFFFLIILLATGVGVLAPETANDSLCYHLHVPKIYLDLNTIKRIPYEVNSLFPFFMEMLDTYGIAFRDMALAKMFHALTGILGGLAVYLGAKRFTSPAAAGLTAILFVSTPGLINQMGTTYVDVSLAAFSAAGLYAYIRWHETRQTAWVILCGLIMGAALSIKFIAFIPLTGICLLFIYDSFKDRKTVLILTAFLVSAFLIAGYWYLRSWIELGNPVYPFFYSIFKSGYPKVTYDDIGVTRTPLNFLLIPWTLTMKPQIFEGFGDNIGPAYLAFLPIGLFAAFKNPLIKRLAFFSLYYFAAWFILGQSVRFLFPALAAFAILAAAGLENLLNAGKFARVSAKTAILLILALHAALAVYHYEPFAKVALGIEKPATFLERVERSYKMAEFVNKNLPPDAKILNALEVRMFYFKRPIVREDFYALETKYHEKVTSEDELRSLLKRDGFTHILLTEGPHGHWVTLNDFRVPKVLLKPENSLASQKPPLYTYTFTDESESMTYSLYQI